MCAHRRRSLCFGVCNVQGNSPDSRHAGHPTAIEFYTQQLGFELAFGDDTDPPNYVGFRRDAVELHMQFQFEHEMGTIRLRFLVEDPDALFNEYRQRGVECTPNSVHDTPWGTREFALYDLDRNALTFYRDLTSAEKGRHSL
jgi:uncharacterized glyoxalase superfamily protein PhnB